MFHRTWVEFDWPACRRRGRGPRQWSGRRCRRRRRLAPSRLRGRRCRQTRELTSCRSVKTPRSSSCRRAGRESQGLARVSVGRRSPLPGREHRHALVGGRVPERHGRYEHQRERQLQPIARPTPPRGHSRKGSGSRRSGTGAAATDRSARHGSAAPIRTSNLTGPPGSSGPARSRSPALFLVSQNELTSGAVGTARWVRAGDGACPQPGDDGAATRRRGYRCPISATRVTDHRSRSGARRRGSRRAATSDLAEAASDHQREAAGPRPAARQLRQHSGDQ